ncbi:MAG: ADP-dependent glucokinase/phosphofructokinase [Candidatus Asgardarchaeia archaeon]
MSNTSLMEYFQKQYVNSINQIASNLEKVTHIVVGFNSNIDAIKKVTRELLQKLPQVTEIKYLPSKRISNIEDLTNGLLFCISKGFGDEWIIEREEIAKWIEKEIKADEYQIGGQGGNMASVAAVLGIRNVITNIPYQCSEIGTFFPNDLIKVPIIENDKTALLSAKKLFGKDKPPIHWIFEYNKGFEFTIKGRRYIAPRANRFIATYDPYIAKCEISNGFKNLPEDILKKVTSFIVGGLHLIRKEFISNIDKKFDEIRFILKRWKKLNPSAPLHFEYGPSTDIELFNLIHKFLSPWIDTLGINEDDLVDIMIALKKKDIAQKIREQQTIISIFEGIIQILKKTNFREIVLHHENFIIHVAKGFKKKLDIRRYSALFGALVCATRAYKGTFPTIAEIKRYFLEGNIFINETSIELCESFRTWLKQFKVKEIDTLVFEGSIENMKISVSVVPTLTARYTKKTVGLGDTFAVSFGIYEGIIKNYFE